MNLTAARTDGERSLPFWCLALVAIALLQFFAERTYVKPYDEGLILYGASVVAHGGVPYRDFWSMYGPGSFYALASVNLAFGESVLVGRLFDAGFRAAIVLLTYLLVRRHAGSKVGLACGGLAFVALLLLREYLFPALPATATALLALWALDGALRAPSSTPWTWAWPGAAVGLTLLFRHDFGLTVMLGCFWALWLARSAPHGLPANAPPTPKSPPTTTTIARLAAFVAGVVVVAGPLYAYLLLKVPFTQLFQQLVQIPAEVYAANRSLPFPRPWLVVHAAIATHSAASLGVLMVYFPIVATVVAAIWVVAHGRRSGASRDGGPARYPEGLYRATFLVLALFTLKGCVRVELVQMLPATLVAIVLGGLSVPAPARERRLPRALPYGALGLVAILGVAWGTSVARAKAGQVDGNATTYAFNTYLHCAPSEVPRLGCFSVDADRRVALQFLAAHAQPGDTIYIGPTRHDKIIVNNVEMYFLSGLPAVTKWADSHPGVQTTAAIQRAMIGDLERHAPTFVLLNSVWDNMKEPNASQYSSGVTLLDDFLHRNYQPELLSGNVSISVPKPGAPPPP